VINPVIGPHGLRSGWRVLAFLFLVLFIGGAAGTVTHLPGVSALGHEVASVLQYGTLLLGVLAALWIMARMEQKPMDAYGLAAQHTGRNLLLGLATGFAALSLLMVLLIAAGAFQPSGRSLRGGAAVYWALESAVLFLLVGFTEELMTRSYQLFTLWRGIGFWPAAAIVSVLFAAGHLANGGEDWIGIANAVLVGLVFAYSVYWSGSLWWAIGCHASWDWAETYFYGVPNSGVALEHHFFSGTPSGPWWLSGGKAGPEGSVLAAVVIVAMAGVVRVTLARGVAETPESDPRPVE
jgi:membrane protease YdiL (CAAX protease family)